MTHIAIIFYLFRAGVRLGEHTVGLQKDCDPLRNICAPPTLDFFIEKFLVHPEYDPKQLLNDIALLRLATTVNSSYGKFSCYFVCFGIFAINNVYIRSKKRNLEYIG